MPEFDELVKEISKQSNLPEFKVRKLVEEKEQELSGLVSREGAAYIVGREMGISLIREGRRQLKVSNIVSGMRSVDVTARVLRVFEPREWEKAGKKGRVANIILGDDSGTIRLSLWNEEVALLEKISEGDVVKITGGFSKEDYKNQPELRIGKGRIETTDEKIDAAFTERPPATKQGVTARARVAGIKEGSFCELRASMLKVFERKNPLFNICPECEGRVEEKNGVFSCAEHGNVKPKQRLIVSGVVDDGSGNIRAVFFGDQAEKILGMKTDEVLNFASGGRIADIYRQPANLGKDFIIRGRVKKDIMAERLEIME